MITKVIAEDKIEATLKLIKKSTKIVITAHKKPDGDAMGSSLALYHFLHRFDKSATIVFPNKQPAYLNILPGSSDILNYEDHTEKATNLINEAELIFALDFNDLNRIGDLRPVIENSTAKIIMIDHHLNHTDFADISISYPEIASASELVFRAICRMGYFNELTKEAAECICAGMLTDTGGLAFNSNSPEIYSIFCELLRKGVDKDAIYDKLFNSYSAKRMQLMGYVLYKKMELLIEDNIAIISLSNAELEKFNFEPGDTEGFVNLPLSIKGINYSILVNEDNQGKVKLSLRSKRDYNVRDFAKAMFNGGGHKNASGAESDLPLEETVNKIKSELQTLHKFNS